jgi:hypothetical protein
MYAEGALQRSLGRDDLLPGAGADCFAPASMQRLLPGMHLLASDKESNASPPQTHAVESTCALHRKIVSMVLKL